jgi:hypothetical protein
VHLECLLRQKLPDFGEKLPRTVGSAATGRTRFAVVAAQSIGIKGVEEKKKNLDEKTTQESVWFLINVNAESSVSRLGSSRICRFSAVVSAELADRKGHAMLIIRIAFLLVTYLSLAACVTSPLSRTDAESSSAVMLLRRWRQLLQMSVGTVVIILLVCVSLPEAIDRLGPRSGLPRH